MNIKYLFAKCIQKMQFAAIKDSIIDKTAHICERSAIYNSQIGRYSYVGANSYVIGTEIGAFTSISSDCEIGLGRHPANFVSMSPVFYQKNNCLGVTFSEYDFDEYSKTKIGNDVWIGSGVRIKSGIEVGDGAIIGAGAVVTSNIMPYSIVGGVPAKLIRFRFTPYVIDELMRIKWWSWEDSQITKMAPYFCDIEQFINIAKNIADFE